MHNVPVICIVSKSRAGKTTVMENLIQELKKRAYRVAIIKHDAHSFEIDHPGKDTWRHYQAGADVVAISSASKFALIERREEEHALDDIIASLPPVDLVLTEGFRRQNKPKIEVYRAEAHATLLCEPHELLALVSDTPWPIDVPQFALEDCDALADFVENYIKQYQEQAAQ